VNVPARLASFRDRGIELRIEDGKLKVSAPKGALDDATRAELSEHKDEIRRFLEAALESSPPAADATRIERTDPSRTEPLSSAQRRLWFLEQLDPASTVNNLPAVFHIVGRLDRDALRRTFREIVRRHDSLRTAIMTTSGEPHQEIEPALDFELPIEDLQDLPAETREAKFLEWIRKDARKPIPIDRAPLIRAALGIVHDDLHILYLCAHHVIWDGWSFDVFVNELRTIYASFATGEPSPLPETPIRYGDYVRHQAKAMASDAGARSLEYFRTKLRGPIPSLELAADRPRPPVRTNAGDCIMTTFDKEVFDRLRRVARTEGATLNMAILAVLYVLLHRYSGTTDLVIATPTDGRTRPEVEGLIGLFLGTLALRLDVNPDWTFAELLTRVRETVLEAFAHQEVPFERIVTAAAPARDRSRTPIYQCLFSYQEVRSRRTDMGPLELVQRTNAHNGSAATDVSLWVRDHGAWAFGAFEYSTDLFDRATAERLMESLVVLLEGASLAPETKVCELPILPLHERARVLAMHRGESTAYADTLVHRLFEGCVDASPDRTALIFEDERLSYAELDARANQLAHELRSRGVGPDSLVGVALPRSSAMVVALLAIAKAGAAYVPLDPTYPRDRIRDMAIDARPALVLVASDGASPFDGTDTPLLVLGTRYDDTATDRPHVDIPTSSLLYVIYTSGSTGRPKGVMVEHRNVVSFLHGMEGRVSFAPGGVFLAGTSISFDISVLEIFGSLTHGMTVALLGEKKLGVAVDERYGIAALIERHGVEVFQCTPSQAAILLADSATRKALGLLRQLLVGGEALPVDLARSLAECVAGEVTNMYGPTETTIWSMTHPVARDARSIPLGTAIANTSVHVLDPRLGPVPVGVAGELCIGGHGVVRGYLGRDELTRERFVVDPFTDDSGPRLYRTGDLARTRNDGTLEFLGRNDFQVKIRGHRIELGEIEACLREHSGIRDAVVVARDEIAGRRLVAYVVSEDESLVRMLRDYASARLPEPMVPSQFVRLDALPLTPNGKIDRAALPDPGIVRAEAPRTLVKPRTETERRLEKIFREEIGIESLGVTDDFFDLGGHSLLAVRIFNRIHETFGVSLALGILFEAASVEKLARRIDDERRRDPTGPIRFDTVIAMKTGGDLPPFFCVSGIGGAPLELRFVAEELGRRRPVYGLQHRGIDGRLEPHRTIAAMAEEFRKDIKARFPNGPYFIGGFSGGGVAAFELARNLTARGDKVAAVVLLDSFNPKADGAPLPERIAAHLRNLRREGPSYIFDRVASRWERRRARTALERRARASEASYDFRHDAVEAAWLEAANTFDETPYPGDVVLIRASERPEAAILVDYDEWNGWKPLVRGRLDVITVPGTHLTLVREDRAVDTAAAIARALDAAAGELRERTGIRSEPPPFGPIDGRR